MMRADRLILLSKVFADKHFDMLTDYFLSDKKSKKQKKGKNVNCIPVKPNEEKQNMEIHIK